MNDLSCSRNLAFVGPINSICLRRRRRSDGLEILRFILNNPCINASFDPFPRARYIPSMLVKLYDGRPLGRPSCDKKPGRLLVLLFLGLAISTSSLFIKTFLFRIFLRFCSVLLVLPSSASSSSLARSRWTLRSPACRAAYLMPAPRPVSRPFPPAYRALPPDAAT